MQNAAQNQRIEWIDVMKLIGIFFVYTVHYAGMGRYGLFFLALLVPCFFFCSGFTANRHANDDVLPFIKNKLCKIVWPYFAFGALSLLVRVLFLQMSQGEIITWVKNFLYASRDRVPVAALWFLPCLFFMSIMYHLLQKIIKNQYLLLLICFIGSAFVKLVREEPVWPWGIDMAVRFMVYYAIGDTARLVLQKNKDAIPSNFEKICLGLITLFCAYLSYVHFYFGRGYFASLVLINEPSYVLQSAEQFVFALAGLWCLAVLAKALSALPFLAKLGKYTLIFCATEQIIKTIVPLAFSAFGLTLSEDGGAVMLMQAMGLIIINYYALAVPIAKYMPWMLDFNKLKNKL